MALIAPGITRFTIVATLSGEDCLNVLDVRHDTFELETRASTCALIAGDLLNQWSDHILPLLSDDYEAEAVRWVDLNDADGSVGSVTSTDGSTWPENGSGLGSTLPNNTYIKMVKVLEGKGRRERNGALRLGGISEGETEVGNGNLLTPATQAAYSAAFEDLKDGINGGFPGQEVNLVVIHTVDREYAGYSEIATFTAAPVVGTLRRRMPGYGS